MHLQQGLSIWILLSLHCVTQKEKHAHIQISKKKISWKAGVTDKASPNYALLRSVTFQILLPRTLMETHFSSPQLLLFLYYWRLWCQTRALRIDLHNPPYSPHTPGLVQCTATQCSNNWKLWCLLYQSTFASTPLVLKVTIDWPLGDQLDIKSEVTRFGPKHFISVAVHLFTYPKQLSKKTMSS